MLAINAVIPQFEVINQNSQTITDEDFKGQWTVLYFYPKDNTPGCTTEAIDFSALKEDFAQCDAQIFGCSADSIKSHCNFIAKKELNIELLSDESFIFLKLFDVWQLKKNYGKEYMGIIRTTYIISPEGKIVEVFKNVRVKGHAQEVLETLRDLQAQMGI